MSELLTWKLVNPEDVYKPLFSYHVLETPEGNLSIITRPGYCDRGRFHSIIELNSPYSVLLSHLSNHYYFDLNIAMKELAQWWYLASIYGNRPLDQWVQPKREKSKVVTTNLFEITIFAVTSPYQGWQVYAHPNLKSPLQETRQSYLLDNQDGFPRYYLNEKYATQEMEAWLKSKSKL